MKLLDREDLILISCQKCYRVFKDKKELSLHEGTCLRLKPDESFLKHHSKNNSYDKNNKVLPPSQSLSLSFIDEDELSENVESSTLASSSPKKGKENVLTTNPDVLPVTATITETVGVPLDHVVEEPLESELVSSKLSSSNTCQNCKKSFKNNRGLNQHMRKCKNKTTEAVLESSNINGLFDMHSSEDQATVDLPLYEEVSIKPSRTYNGITPDDFVSLIEKVYDDTVKWKKNLFMLPSGQSGKTLIKLLTEWINHFNVGDTFQGIALKVVMILPNLLMQKPSAKSKAKEHSKLLEERIRLWNSGEISELFDDGNAIQKRLSKSKRNLSRDVERTFTKLMLEGKVSSALKYLDENAENAVLPLTEEVIDKLKTLHPTPSDIIPTSLIHGNIEKVPSSYFQCINEQEIMKAAKHTKGSGGPSLLDAKQWTRILCSNQFKVVGKELREELAQFARKIATKVIDPDILEAYTACRLIPINKAPESNDLSVRPIGVGEVLRRIIGKTIAWALNDDIQEAGGPLQVSTGLKGGAEAAIHSMKMIFEQDNTDAVILVDAENAFNRLNRQVALHNIRFLCPPFATVLINTYRKPSRLFIHGGGEISSMEGTTQGDTLAMAFYGISVTPLIKKLKDKVNEVAQVWLADDATGAGKLDRLKLWWISIISEGKSYGYYVKPTKSWLILKDSAKLQEAEKLFEDCPVNITTQGMRHLGAAIGSNEFKESYISGKVKEWCMEIRKLSTIAKSQPHVAYSAYIHGEQHKFTYFLRTIEGINEQLKPLDEVLNNEFIPALFGCEIDENERNLIAMPIKEGGLGIRLISSNADSSYQTSKDITYPLVDKILNQDQSLPEKNIVENKRKSTINALKQSDLDKINDLKSSQSNEMKKLIEQHSQSGSWLGALPLQLYGFNLNKGEFQDALCLRYNKRLKNLPAKCPCGADYNITHALNCHKGGFINARHDNIRNMEAKLLKEVCTDVEIEPHLHPVNGGTFHSSANTSDESRLDIRARGFWRHSQNAFFDVRVTNPDSASQRNMSLKSVLNKHEKEKKRHYNRRIMEIEHGTFTPLIFTTSGVMGHECNIFHKALAEKLSLKKGDRYDEVMRYLRVKISYLALKSTLMCIRGSRSTFKMHESGCDFELNLIELGL